MYNVSGGKNLAPSKNGTTCITSFKLVRNIWRFPNPFNEFYFLLARKTLIGSGKFPIFVMAQVLHDIFLASKISESLKQKGQKKHQILRTYLSPNTITEIIFETAFGINFFRSVSVLPSDWIALMRCPASCWILFSMLVDPNPNSLRAFIVNFRREDHSSPLLHRTPI